MKTQDTGWFPGNVKPVRAGLYKVREEIEPNDWNVWFDWWDGLMWCDDVDHRPYDADEQNTFTWCGRSAP